MPADPTPKLAEARAAEPNMSDLRHTWEPISRYTCPACGEVLLRRDPNDLCPVKVALRLATKDAEVDRLTAKLAEARAMGRREGLEEAAKIGCSPDTIVDAAHLAVALAEVDRLTAELAEARAMGRREGLEEAARIAEVRGWHLDMDQRLEHERTVRAIRAKVTP